MTAAHRLIETSVGSCRSTKPRVPFRERAQDSQGQQDPATSCHRCVPHVEANAYDGGDCPLGPETSLKESSRQTVPPRGLATMHPIGMRLEMEDGASTAPAP